MSQIDVALISPPPYSTSGKHASLGGSENLGLGYLAAALERAGYTSEIFIIEEPPFLTPEEAVERISALKPCLIGLSPTSYSMMWAEKFCVFQKAKNTTPIAMGGHLATHMGAQLFECIKGLDIVCLGDGDATICDIVASIKQNTFNFSNICNLVFQDPDGLVVTTPSDKVLCNLDVLPWPKHHMIGRKTARILTSRGCLYNCSFCTTPAFYKQKVRHRDIGNVVDEMVTLNKRHGVNRFFFSDDSFVDNTAESLARVQLFIGDVKKRLPNIEFRCEIRADVIAKNVTIVKQLFDAGMKYLFVGYESCVENDLSTYNKSIDVKTIMEVPSLLRDIGISVVPGFIMYGPDTTFEDLHTKIKFLLDNNYLYRTTFFARTCMGYPGSAYFKNMIQSRGYDEERSNQYLLYPNFSVQGIKPLSVAFETIELQYLDIDSLMLNAVIYQYEKRILRSANISDDAHRKTLRATEILTNLQKLYYEMFQKSLGFAQKDTEQSAIQKITQLFSHQFDFIKSSVDEFSSMVADIDNA